MTLQEKLSQPIIKLDIGSGCINMKQPLDEWIRVDAVEMPMIDLICNCNDMPVIKSDSASEIWAGDVCEHIPTFKHDKTFGELNRVLKIGGVFGGKMPNLWSTMERFVNGELSLDHAIGALYGANDTPYQQHYMTFTYETFTVLLEKYGFGEIDFSGSPSIQNGDVNKAWWLVWTCKKYVLNNSGFNTQHLIADIFIVVVCVW